MNKIKDKTNFNPIGYWDLLSVPVLCLSSFNQNINKMNFLEQFMIQSLETSTI